MTSVKFIAFSGDNGRTKSQNIYGLCLPFKSNMNLPDIPFCLSLNNNRFQDEEEIIKTFFEIYPYFQSRNYIRLRGKCLLFIKTNNKKFIDLWQYLSKKEGVDVLFCYIDRKNIVNAQNKEVISVISSNPEKGYEYVFRDNEN